MGQHIGNIILKAKKKEFESKLEEIRKKIETFKKEAKENIKAEFKQSKKSLIEVLRPRIVKNPPSSLIGKISGGKPTNEQAEMYLEDRLNKVIPNASQFIKNMELICNFKDVTHEMLKNSDFQKAVRKVYPYEEWKNLLKKARPFN